MKKLILSFLAAVTAATPALALDQIVRPYQSARAAGMGGVIHTTGMYDEIFFGNPARASAMPKWRLDVLNSTLEVNSGAIQNFDKVTASGDKVENVSGTAGTNNHVRQQLILPAFYKPHFWSDDNFFAIGLIESTQGDIDLRRNYNIEPNVYADIGPAVTFARRYMKDRLTAGVTAHYMYRMTTNQAFTTVDYLKGSQFKNIKDRANEGAMLDADLGATYQIEKKFLKKWQLQPALTIQRVAGGKFGKAPIDLNKSSDTKPANQRRAFNGGLSLSREHWLVFSSFVGALEVQDVGNNPNGSLFRTIHLGAEAGLLKDWFKLRAGLNQGYLAAGFGIDLRILDIDFATYGEEMSLNPGGLEDRRYVLKFALSI